MTIVNLFSGPIHASPPHPQPLLQPSLLSRCAQSCPLPELTEGSAHCTRMLFEKSDEEAMTTLPDYRAKGSVSTVCKDDCPENPK